MIISPPARASKHAQNESSEPLVDGLVLQAKTDECVRMIILRPEDKIASRANPADSLTFLWTPPHVEVQSSEKKTEVTQAEDETEDDNDDDDLDNTIVPGIAKSQTMRSTPHLSMSHSVVIQETPTTTRVGDALPLHPPQLNKEASTATAVVYSTAPQGQSIVNDLTLSDEPAEAEDLGASEAVPQKSPLFKVAIPKSRSAAKRPSPAKEDPGSQTTRASKRRKMDEDDTAATPVQTARKAATKKRQSAVKAEPTPVRSQRNTPTSTASSVKGSPVDVEGDYEGPKPRVALSNSAIQPNSSFVRFLKRNGGSITDAVQGNYNILW